MRHEVQDHPAHRFCQRLIAIVLATLDAKKARIPASGWKAVVLSVLTKMISEVRAAHALAADGHIRGAPIVIRAALESFITASFIAQADSALRARRWVQYGDVLRAAMLRKKPYPALKDAIHKRTSRLILARGRRWKKKYFPGHFWASGFRRNNLRDLAQAVGMQWHYDMIYWSYSQGTHTSPIGVASYVAAEKAIYDFALSGANVRADMAVCCDLLVRGLELLNGCCRWGLGKLLEDLREEYRTLDATLEQST